MRTTLFPEYLERYFAPVMTKIAESFNGKQKEQELLHKTLLTEEYSPTLKWNSTELSHSIVAADVVSMGSTLPLKSRSSMRRAEGDIPKLGISFKLDEQGLSDIELMKARGASEATIVGKIFDDVVKAVKGIEVRKEIMFLEALSSGAFLIPDLSEKGTNQGTGIRVSFGYKEENTFKTKTKAWGETGYTPLDDVQQLFDKADADGSTIAHVYMSRKYFDLFRHSEQGRQLSAGYLKLVITAKKDLPTPTRETFLAALKDEFGATFHVVDSTFRVEKLDGTKQSVKPWAEASVVGVQGDTVGKLFYGTLVEETKPIEGVTYQKFGSHTLISKYSTPNPYEEVTMGQALVIPVIDGVESVYRLEADKAPD